MAAPRSGYHHGDLPAAVLDAVDEIVRADGPAAVSIRRAARHVGVSNAAPRHHFGDKAGLLTAYATQGFDELAARLSAAGGEATAPDRLLQAGLAYVAFALDEPGRFAVMFRPELLRSSDPDYQRTSRAAFDELLDAVRERRGDPERDEPALSYAAAGAWSIVHGFATLWLQGVLPAPVTDEPPAAAAARALAEYSATVHGG